MRRETLSSIHTIRQRKPFLNCLRTLCHAGGGTHERHIREVRPIRPTDSDIRDFTQVQLKAERDFMPEVREEAYELLPVGDAVKWPFTSLDHVYWWSGRVAVQTALSSGGEAIRHGGPDCV